MTRVKTCTAMWLLTSILPAAALPSADWPTFGGNAQRLGYNGAEKILSTSTVPGLKLHWKVDLGANAYYQPNYIRNVKTATGKFDVVFVSTGAGIAAVDSATGNILWSAQFSPVMFDCLGQQRTLETDEPATIDAAKGLLYVVDGAGLLHALTLGSGEEQTGYPVEVIDAPNLAAGTHVSKASPTLAGRDLYIGTAASCENKKVPYHGQIIKFDLSTQSVVNRFYPVGNEAVYGGGIWGPGGVSIDPDGSYVWAATANALPPPENQGNAEKIIQLTANLKLIGAEGPSLRTHGDLDFGATPLLFQPTGCPPMLAAMNKSGIVQVYSRTNFGSGPLQTLQISKGGGSGVFFGMPAFDPVLNTIYLSNPADSPDGTYLHGLIALQVGSDCQLSLLWHADAGVTVDHGRNPAVPPTVANGVVWYAAGIGKQVEAFDAATGNPLWDSGKTINGMTLASPMIANGQVFFLGGSVLYAYGL